MDIDPQMLVALIAAMLISLTLHELAHARTALAFGDPTAQMMGRISLNPLRHLDPIGSIALVLSMMAGAGIGWAKPVPVNPANLHPRRLGDIMVSLAGPMANLGLAVAAGLLLRLMVHHPRLLTDPGVAKFLRLFLWVMMTCNLSLFLFNLLPLYPLDGHHIQREVLPTHLQGPYMQWQLAYGRYILLAIVFLPGLLQKILHQPIFDPLDWIYNHVMDPMIQVLVGV
jgi:Zn-dependent protease